MKNHNAHLGNFQAIIGFKKPPVDIQLNCVLPVIARREMRQRPTATLPIIRLLDLLGTLPIVNYIIIRGFAIKHHINGTGELVLLTPNLPLTPVGNKILLDIIPKIRVIEPFRSLLDLRVDQLGRAVQKLLDGEMEGGSLRRCLTARIIPLLLDLGRCLPEILTVGPILGFHHFINDGIGVEIGEKMVEELGTTDPALGHPVHSIDVSGFVEDDMGVAFVCICMG